MGVVLEVIQLEFVKLIDPMLGELEIFDWRLWEVVFEAYFWYSLKFNSFKVKVKLL